MHKRWLALECFSSSCAIPFILSSLDKSMLANSISVAAVLASLISASGASVVRRQELENTISQVEIHSSCNATARSELRTALNETYELINSARNCTCSCIVSALLADN